MENVLALPNHYLLLLLFLLYVLALKLPRHMGFVLALLAGLSALTMLYQAESDIWAWFHGFLAGVHFLPSLAQIDISSDYLAAAQKAYSLGAYRYLTYVLTGIVVLQLIGRFRKLSRVTEAT